MDAAEPMDASRGVEQEEEGEPCSSSSSPRAAWAEGMRRKFSPPGAAAGLRARAAVAPRARAAPCLATLPLSRSSLFALSHSLS